MKNNACKWWEWWESNPQRHSQQRLNRDSATDKSHSHKLRF